MNRPLSAQPVLVAAHVDAGILTGIACGEQDAVGRAIDRFGPLIWSIARTYCRAQHDAEDAVQEAFLKLWRAAPRYDPNIASEAAFVATVARNAIIDFRRRRPHEVPIDLQAATASSVPIDKPNFPIDSQHALSAMRMLSDDQQEALRLTIQRGLTQQEVATALSIPLGTVKTRVRTALMTLQTALGVPSRRVGQSRQEAAP